MNLRGLVQSLLRLTGKSNQKVAAVFGLSPAACHTAVMHIRQGAPGVPVWLYSTTAPWPETAALCERVRIHRSSLAILFHAPVELWQRWVALGVSTWTGEHGAWPLKLAPFAIPPFRALILNEHGDFFGGSPSAIALHGRRRIGDAAHSLWRLVVHDLWRCAGVRRVRHVASARCLLAAATLLRWCGYPHRNVFHRLHGKVAARPLSIAPRGCGITEFVPPTGGWNSDAFASAVLDSQARWLLWSENGKAEGLEDLLPLFREERTFAVSRQEHYRAWTPGLLPTAPFRPLQPGESCRVLAPVSRTILVDRAKLAALGIPRCGLPGTTWMLIFWKAAAAGWVSYSAGQQGAPSRRSDQPLEETAFFFRVLADRRLRELVPAEADLSRGTISIEPAPSARRPYPSAARPRPKVLLVSPFLPFPLSHGGAVRIYNLCRALSSRVEFALAAIREQHETVDYGRLHEIFSQVHIVDLDEPPSPDERLPRQVRHAQSRSLRALIVHLCETWKPDLLQIEYTHMAGYRDAAPHMPALLVEHDITFSLYRQLAASQPTAAAQAELERWHSFESHWLRRFDGVWTVSEEDRLTAIAEGCSPGRTFAIPNGVDTSRFIPGEDPASPEIFFVGSFRHIPNVMAFDILCREIMPRVWERFSEARLCVVAGPDHQTFWHRFAPAGSAHIADRRIAIHGFVEDLRPLYANTSVVVAPLEVSAGTNIKVLEAMACGKPVVSTTVGCSGLGLQHGEDALIADGWPSFSDAICELLGSSGRRRAIGAAARRAVEARFSWSTIADQALASYLDLAPPHHSISSNDTPWRGSENSMGTVPPAVTTHFGESSKAS